MAQQGQGFDLSKVSTADKIILGGAVGFIIWVFLPVWYSYPAPLGGISGFHNTVIISWFLALVALLEIVVVKMMGTELKMPIARGLLHLAIAGVALLFTLLGLVAKPTFSSLSWGIFVGLALNLVWAYGAYMLYSEPVSTTPPPPSGTGLG